MNGQKRVTSNITIEGATLVCRNFKGKGDDFNHEGNRNFGVLLDDDLAESLMADGWNVKHFRPREDDPDQHSQAWLKVNVSYRNSAPIVNLITSKGKKKLDESTIDQLDWTRMANVDLIISPYNYEGRGGRPGGVSAYLKALYVTVREDPLEEKYADIPDLDEPDEVDDVDEEAPFE